MTDEAKKNIEKMDGKEIKQELLRFMLQAEVKKQILKGRRDSLHKSVLKADMEFRLNARRNRVNYTRSAWDKYRYTIIATVFAKPRDVEINSLCSFLKSYPEIRDGTSVQLEGMVRDYFPYFVEDTKNLHAGYLEEEDYKAIYSACLPGMGLSDSTNPCERDKEFFQELFAIETSADRIVNSVGLLDILKEEKKKIDEIADSRGLSKDSSWGGLWSAFLMRLNNVPYKAYPEILDCYGGLSQQNMRICREGREKFESELTQIDKVIYREFLTGSEKQNGSGMVHPFVDYLFFNGRVRKVLGE